MSKDQWMQHVPQSEIDKANHYLASLEDRIATLEARERRVREWADAVVKYDEEDDEYGHADIMAARKILAILDEGAAE